MSDLISVQFEDGSWRVVNLENKTEERAIPGLEVHEWDIAFDDISDGLYVYFSRLTAAPDGELDESPDPEKGYRSYMERDFYIQVLTAEELNKVMRISYSGVAIYERIFGELVPLQRISMLGNQYLNDKQEASFLVIIAQLSECLEREIEGKLPEESASDEEAKVDTLDIVAAKLGVSRTVIEQAREFNTAEDNEIEVVEEDEDLAEDAGPWS